MGIYLILGRPVRIKKYQTNDTVREYAYGPFDRIEYTRDYVIGTGSYLKTSYEYDALGRIISKTVTKNGTFKNSVHYIHVLKTGNSFREWHINNYNCAFMASQVMRKGLEGDEYKSKRAAIMKIQYNYRQGKHYLKTVIPVEAFNRLASIWGVKKQTIK